MTQSPLRAAVVGCGVIGRLHLRAIAAHPRFEAFALVDTDASARARLKYESGAALVEGASLSEILASKTRPDVVVVSTPSGTHAETCRTCIARRAACSGRGGYCHEGIAKKQRGPRTPLFFAAARCYLINPMRFATRV